MTHAQNDADSADTLHAGRRRHALPLQRQPVRRVRIDDRRHVEPDGGGGYLESAVHLRRYRRPDLERWTMAGSGQTIAKGSVSIDNGILDTRSFTSDGTTTLSGTLSFDNSAGFTSANTATFNAQTGASLEKGDSLSPTFSNAGDFNVEPDTADTVTDTGVAFTSTGTVAVASGTLALDDPGGTDSGSFTVALNATLAFGETATTLSPQSSVSGDGNVVFDNNDTATIDGGYSIGSLDALAYATADEPGLDGPFGTSPPRTCSGRWT